MKTNFQDLVARVENSVALAPVLGAISRPVTGQAVNFTPLFYQHKLNILEFDITVFVGSFYGGSFWSKLYYLNSTVAYFFLSARFLRHLFHFSFFIFSYIHLILVYFNTPFLQLVAKP